MDTAATAWLLMENDEQKPGNGGLSGTADNPVDLHAPRLGSGSFQQHQVLDELPAFAAAR
jgi:hypothetical protein